MKFAVLTANVKRVSVSRMQDIFFNQEGFNEGNILLMFLIDSFNHLGVTAFQRFWRKIRTHLIDDNGNCRTAPAAPGLSTCI